MGVYLGTPVALGGLLALVLFACTCFHRPLYTPLFLFLLCQNIRLGSL